MAKAVKKTAETSKKATPAKASVPANAMDYSEHEKTYDLFLRMSIWTTVGCVALLLAMMVGFFLGGGLIGGSLVFAILMAVAFFLL